jgi:hypothetical protein
MDLPFEAPQGPPQSLGITRGCDHACAQPRGPGAIVPDRPGPRDSQSVPGPPGVVHTPVMTSALIFGAFGVLNVVLGVLMSAWARDFGSDWVVKGQRGIAERVQLLNSLPKGFSSKPELARELDFQVHAITVAHRIRQAQSRARVSVMDPRSAAMVVGMLTVAMALFLFAPHLPRRLEPWALPVAVVISLPAGVYANVLNLRRARRNRATYLRIFHEHPIHPWPPAGSD